MQRPFEPTHAIVFDGGTASDAQDVCALFNCIDECNQAFIQFQDDGSFYIAELLGGYDFKVTFAKPADRI